MPIVKPEVSLTAYTFKSGLVVTEYCIELASTPALCLVGSEFKSRPYIAVLTAVSVVDLIV